MSILCGRFILSSTGSLVRKLSLITVAMFGEILHEEILWRPGTVSLLCPENKLEKKF